MATQLPFLPEIVVVEILARLPARSVAICRAVCRAWRAAAAHPCFEARSAAVAKITATRGFAGAPLRSSKVVVLFDFFRGRWHRGNVHKRPPAPRGICFNWPEVPSAASSMVVGSWDGVLCLHPFTLRGQPPDLHLDRGRERLLWNPLADAFAVASVPAAAGGGRVIGGYAHPATRRFHLLYSEDDAAVPGRRDALASPVTFRVLRVGDDDWREVPWRYRSRIWMKRDGDRPVSLHGNLHWLVQSADTGRLALLVFDAAREEFRPMAAPECRGRDLTTARIVASLGKLCTLALAEPPATTRTLEMWVLDDYHCSDSRGGWRLREKIRTVRLDGVDLWEAFAKAATAVEVVDDGHRGEEMFLQTDGLVGAYNIRDRAWIKVSVTRWASLVLHRSSFLQPDISFGEAKLTPQRVRCSLYYCDDSCDCYCL